MARWHAVILEGPSALVRAFVTAFAAGRGEPGSALFTDDVALEHESLGDRLKDLLGRGHHVVFAPELLAAALAEAVQEHGHAVGIGLERSQPVAAASFSFRVEVFSRDLAHDVRAALVTALPPDVHVQDLVEHEEEHPDAKGPEPFAPLHAYAYRAEGRIVGPLPGVLDVRRRACEWESVTVGLLRIDGLG